MIAAKDAYNLSVNKKEKVHTVIDTYLSLKIAYLSQQGFNTCWFIPKKECVDDYHYGVVTSVFVQGIMPEMLKNGYEIEQVRKVENAHDTCNAFIIYWNLNESVDLDTMAEE